MFIFPPTIILRHRKENLKKCSLRGLETKADIQFLTYPKDPLPSLENYILLTIDAPPLTYEDRSNGIFLIDGTWRYAAAMEKHVKEKIHFIPRSIPSGFVTAYPRRQQDCIDPEKGLSSLEALYISYLVTGRETQGLFDLYHWKDLFYEKNILSLNEQIKNIRSVDSLQGLTKT